MAKKESGDINKVLLENFVSLQRVMTNLSLKLDNLASQISKLLELFEISAKTIAERANEEKAGNPHGTEHSKELARKMDNLIEQNKVIARGLTLIHESSGSKPSRENYEIPRSQMPSKIQERQAFSQNFQHGSVRKHPRTENYQKSMSDQKDEQDTQP